MVTLGRHAFRPHRTSRACHLAVVEPVAVSDKMQCLAYQSPNTDMGHSKSQKNNDNSDSNKQ